jgi:hypothetical protein
VLAGIGFLITGTNDDDGLPRSSMDIDPPTKNGLDTADSHSMDVDESSPDRNAKANGTAAAAPTNNATASSAPSTVTTTTATTLDCYPYTFTPLLLFAPENYFDKGYSNYNAVAQFFSSVMPINMLDNVLFERRNLLYEELFDHIVTHSSFVTCCIDAHFTAIQILSKNAAIYYDPCSPRIKLVTGESFRTLTLYLLIKCNYGDSEHVRDNKDYYVNSGSAVRRTIYSIWKNINRINSVATLSPMKMSSLNIDTDRFFFINSPGYPTAMTTQRTGNTCYFQVYLYVSLLLSLCWPCPFLDSIFVVIAAVDRSLSHARDFFFNSLLCTDSPSSAKWAMSYCCRPRKRSASQTKTGWKLP